MDGRKRVYQSRSFKDGNFTEKIRADFLEGRVATKAPRVALETEMVLDIAEWLVLTPAVLNGFAASWRWPSILLTRTESSRRSNVRIRAIRIDRLDHNDDIDNKIISEINKADFAIFNQAMLTGYHCWITFS